ncbi:DJ-1 family glyoxalase III [Gallaecimonas xiamenensis]|uniref:DJ-1 family protein n=1 Tax=Gallaecimonas xiamenensis 3-C-1 TaxID=745411 RepID=K2JB68_9GAMM|nr:DJ-1 family glyoxalase III [Gallaecimonas xiamenensis]EKE72378.1 DJ-1 family protein [Gallaecimonas xiamenensis 3-C-1]
MSAAWIACAKGSEELEVVGVANVLRRAGIDTDIVSMEDELEVSCARRVTLKADRLWPQDPSEAERPDILILPGGLEGTERLAQHGALVASLQARQKAGRWLAAMDTAPVLVLKTHGLLPDKAQVTGHPGFHDRLPAQGLKADALTVTDYRHRLITSQGPGTAMLFALSIIEVLAGEDVAQRIAAPLVLP